MYPASITTEAFYLQAARHPVVSWVKKVGGAGRCIFPTENCKLPTQDIMSAQNFNFPPNFPKMGVFSHKFCIFVQQFFEKEKIFRQFSDSTKFREGQLFSCHDATGTIL